MLEELRNATSLFASWVISIGGAGAIFVGLYRWFKKPDLNRDEKLKGHDEKLDNDNRRILDIERRMATNEQANEVTMRSILALMNNAIDGDHVDDLKKARDDMNDFLFNKLKGGIL